MNQNHNTLAGTSTLQTNFSKKKRISKPPEDRKQEILDTAMALFTQKGYANTTIQDISEKIGISQGLCYRYFKSKSEIFAAASEQYAFSTVQELSIPFDDNMSSIEKLNFLLYEMYKYIIKSYEFDSIYYSEGQEKINTDIQLSKLKGFSGQLITVLTNIILQGIQEKVMVCEYIEDTAKFLSNSMVYTFHADAPKENIQTYATQFIISLRNLLVNCLQIKTTHKNSQEWYEKEIEVSE